jgi:hypothetical protein
VNTRISTLQHLRPLRGGAQSHLLRASDGFCYVTKFQNNPQHIQVLARLPMPRVEVIKVSDWLIEHTEDSESSWAVPRFRAEAANNWDRSTWTARVRA